MKNNYYDFLFDNSLINKSKLDYYESLSSNQLLEELNIKFDSIDYDLRYYSKIIDYVLKGQSHEEHYYRILGISEDINNIKIILTILKDKDFDEE